jgi:hypothetical protein
MPLYVYGPEVEFDAELFPDINHRCIAQTAFYSDSELSKKLETEANQAPLPTAMSVTPRAEARVAPATAAAEL